MKRNVFISLVLFAIMCSFTSCGIGSTEYIEKQAVQFALDTGYDYYTKRIITKHDFYKSCEYPELESIKSYENKYFDIRCKIECIASVLYPNDVDQQEMYYELRLEYIPSNQSFDIVKERWGGF